MKKLYSFHWDCGRMGDVNGLFIEDSDFVDSMIGYRVYFGEILGKHSEIYGNLSEDDLEVISEDQEKIEWLAEVIGSNTISGYNPMDYIRINCSFCDNPIVEDGWWSKYILLDNGEYICNDREYLEDGEKTCWEKRVELWLNIGDFTQEDIDNMVVKEGK